VKTQYVSFFSLLGMHSEMYVQGEGVGSEKSEKSASRSKFSRSMLWL
jgi:hypothetical protein